MHNSIGVTVGSAPCMSVGYRKRLRETAQRERKRDNCQPARCASDECTAENVDTNNPQSGNV